MRRICALALTTALLLTLTACGDGKNSSSAQDINSSQSSGERGEQEQPTVRTEMAKLPDANWANLTTEMMQQDFDYLCQTLRESYPYIPLAQRSLDISFDDAAAGYRTKIEQCKTDVQFFLLLDDFCAEFENLGHLSKIALSEYDLYLNTYTQLAQQGLDPRFERLAGVYGDERVRKTYAALAEISRPVIERLQQYYAQQSQQGGSQSEDAGGNQTETPANLETRIIEEGKIAYIKVRSFDTMSIEADAKILEEFYTQVGDYEHVIFDLSENGGGNSMYFDNLIAAPNIAQPLSTTVYMAIMDSENNAAIIDIDSSWATAQELLSDLPRMNPADLACLDYALAQELRVEPSSVQPMLRGKLWMLVSERVYSSAEYAAMFSKATGFAELVGTPTGGDGIGVDPVPVILPHSGILLRYSAVYGAQPDGAGSEEFGTIPDIICRPGQTPLERCLEEIERLGAQ